MECPHVPYTGLLGPARRGGYTGQVTVMPFAACALLCTDYDGPSLSRRLVVPSGSCIAGANKKAADLALFWYNKAGTSG